MVIKEFCVVFKKVRDRKYPILIKNGEDFSIDLCDESFLWDVIKEYKNNGYEQVYPKSFFYRSADKFREKHKNDNGVRYYVNQWNGNIVRDMTYESWLKDTQRRLDREAEEKMKNGKLKLCSWWSGYEDVETFLKYHKSVMKSNEGGE